MKFFSKRADRLANCGGRVFISHRRISRGRGTFTWYLFFYRTRRLRDKFVDLRESGGSRLQAIGFVVKFCWFRFNYLYNHLAARYRSRQTVSKRLGERDKGDSRPYLAIKIVGGIGDHIIAARYLRDLAGAVEPFCFDIFCNDIENARWIFGGVPGIGNFYSEFLFEDAREKYDLGLWLSHFVVIWTESANWRKLRSCPRLYGTLQAIVQFRPKIDHIVHHHPRLDNFLGRRAVFLNLDRRNFAHAMSKIEQGDNGLALTIDESVLRSLEGSWGGAKSYVTIHNGFDPNHVVTERLATKCYPQFDEVVRSIKRARPDLAIVQLGTSTSQLISGTDHNLIGKTTLPQAAAILKNATWHVDIESGLVHLAQCFGTRSTVVFGPTSLDYFAYPDNRNIAPAACGGCWWITETWMAKCPRGFQLPICTTQDPAQIAEVTLQAVSEISKSNMPYATTVEIAAAE
jgi:hypothetical protein